MVLRDVLNKAQYEAVTTIDGPVLVIAGAGTGKTRVIEYRVYHLIQNNIRPEAILLLTFTRRAARLMLSRAAKHDPRCKNVEGGTFHSLAYSVIKRYAQVLGFNSSITVFDQGDAEEALNRCAVRLGFYEQKKRFPKKDTLKNIISMSTNKEMSIEDVMLREHPYFVEHAADIRVLRDKYTEYKINSNCLDYDDLLVYMKLLLQDDAVRDTLSKQFNFIMVDEYQDTNKLQGDIVYLLAQTHTNIMIVGDDAQTIYGFRGATHENIMRFPEQFPGCKIIKLEDNYRSTQPILDIANSVLESMKNKYSKSLISFKGKSEIGPQFAHFKNDHEEAEWIADKIKEFRDNGIELQHQCVLYRSGYLSIPLQVSLRNRNIPFIVYGGKMFYETAHVKDIVAHLKILVNPKDELSWSRILESIEGVGPKKSEQIINDIKRCAHFDCIISDALIKQIEKNKAIEGLVKLQSLLKSLIDKERIPGELFEIIFEYYIPILKNNFDDWEIRLKDLEVLKNISTQYASLEQLLADFSIEPPEKSVAIGPGDPEESPVILSTIHSAKGLEWECVFLIGLMDGTFPSSYALRNDEDIEEEKRLCYVALTRAKRYLFMSMHHVGNNDGIVKFNKISRFIETPNVWEKLLKNSYNLHLSSTSEQSGETNSDASALSQAKNYDKQSLLEQVRKTFK